MLPKTSLLKFRTLSKPLKTGIHNKQRESTSESTTKLQPNRDKQSSIDMKKLQNQDKKNEEKEYTKEYKIQNKQKQKTEAQKAFELVKRRRLIQKNKDKLIMSNRERLERRNKQLSKLPDHFDLAKTGQKIQKGY